MRRWSRAPSRSSLVPGQVTPAGEALMGSLSEGYDGSMLPAIRRPQHVVAIGQLRSFGRAARALGMSPPAPSKSIEVSKDALKQTGLEK